VDIFAPQLAEIAQLMNALEQNKNLSDEQFFRKMEKVIPIVDNYAFLMAVKVLEFKPGLAFISQKYVRTGDYFFPKAEYEYWMQLIQRINPRAYKTLKECEAANGKPCIEIQISKDLESVKPGDKQSHGYALLLIDPAMKLWNQKDQEKVLSIILKSYNQVLSLKKNVREY